jgi:hypothetical protein
MKTITAKDKTIAIANYITDIQEQLDAKYTPSSIDETVGLSSLFADMVCMFDAKFIREIGAKAMIESRKEVPPNIKLWTYTTSVMNWLSWAWHKEEEPELSQAWADAWNEVNHWSLENLKGDDLTFYIQKTD